jgi:D-glycero-D-manno-heptose 1,7-bisphosphate phosphatase
MPKPMVHFHGRPFLAYLLEQLRGQEIQEVLLLVGYLAQQIQDYFGDGAAWGLRIRYVESPVEAETGQRLLDAAPLIAPTFLLLYCDNYWPMQLAKMWDVFQQSEAPAMVTVYNNRDGYTRSNVLVDDEGYITTYDPERVTPNLNGVEIGYAILKRDALEYLPPNNPRFEHTVYPALVSRRLLRAFQTDHRYYSVGSHQRLPLTEAFLEPQRAVILDRDGVLNRKPPRAQYVRRWEEFQWLPGTIEALRLLKQARYKLIVVTNQPGIARGLMTEDDLEDIHTGMRTELSAAGAPLDAIYYCPHGWDEGCFCRKPQPGMLFQAQRDFHLDLTRTLFIGDDGRDVQAGQTAGCPTALVSEKVPLLDVVNRHLATEGNSVSFPPTFGYPSPSGR